VPRSFSAANLDISLEAQQITPNWNFFALTS
jgi:hypothetical protein